MELHPWKFVWKFGRPIFIGGLIGTWLLLLPALSAQAQDKTPYVMKISTPTIHDIPDEFARNFGAAVEKDSGGRIKAEVYLRVSSVRSRARSRAPNLAQSSARSFRRNSWSASTSASR